MQGSLFDSISSIPSYLIDTNTLVPYKCQVPSVQSDQTGGAALALSYPGLNLNVSPEAAKTPFTFFFVISSAAGHVRASEPSYS